MHAYTQTHKDPRPVGSFLLNPMNYALILYDFAPTDKTTGGFTHQVCIWHIVSRCGRKKDGGAKTRGQHINIKSSTLISTMRISMFNLNLFMYCICAELCAMSGFDRDISNFRLKSNLINNKVMIIQTLKDEKWVW